MVVCIFLWPSNLISYIAYGGTEMSSRIARMYILGPSHKMPCAAKVSPRPRNLSACRIDAISMMLLVCVNVIKAKLNVSHTALQTPHEAGMTYRMALSSFDGFHRDKTNKRQAWKKKPAAITGKDKNLKPLIQGKWHHSNVYQWLQFVLYVSIACSECKMRSTALFPFQLVHQPPYSGPGHMTRMTVIIEKTINLNYLHLNSIR